VAGTLLDLSLRFVDLSLNQWMPLTPPELVQVHLNIDQQTLSAQCKRKQIIVR
jgi:oxalate decarboxylase